MTVDEAVRQSAKRAASQLEFLKEAAERYGHANRRRTMSLEELMEVMTPERFDMIRHLLDHPERSVRQLARCLKRDYRRVHEDVVRLEEAGLIERGAGCGVHLLVDKVTVDIV